MTKHLQVTAVFQSTFLLSFPVPIHAEQMWKNTMGGWKPMKVIFFFSAITADSVSRFSQCPLTLTCIPSLSLQQAWMFLFFLSLPHLILLGDWKAKISAMQITVSCACRSAFQWGTRPSAAGSRPRRKQERSMQRLPFSPNHSSNFLLLASHKGCFVEGPQLQSASYDCRAAGYMFSFEIGHHFVYFRKKKGTRRCLLLESTFPALLFFPTFFCRACS